jgi:hypothetical protein
MALCLFQLNIGRLSHFSGEVLEAALKCQIILPQEIHVSISPEELN